MDERVPATEFWMEQIGQFAGQDVSHPDAEAS